ncbi:PEBP-like protein [Cystobasidium minutum MCA 4210]|uniref:PEBP-like protein n=1 Tax=Cystobasidium minutum MCA 4210 TaxID=1397322 RepID=UPI0034CED372|eukprot:jgi/Rhomi1/164815/fgenesh1_kg.1_\
MQTCCRAARRALSRRSLATAATQASASSSAASTSSAGAAATSYSRPVPQGSLPVYDEALAYIEQDRKEKLKALEDLKKELQSLGSDASSSSRSELQNRITATEIASMINDPEVRWQFRNGAADMSKPVNRYLAEQAWRDNGDLGILMQRVSQMNIVPDLIGHIAPQVDLRVSLKGGYVEPGSFINPNQTIKAPKLKVQVYHPEERLYTLLMVDPDSPDAATDGFRTKCHLAVANIPLSATVDSIDLSAGRTLLSYTPPHPEKGTRYHRYTYLLLEQSQALPDQTVVSEEHIKDFDVRSFAAEHSLEPVGVTFFRQVWDQDVPTIFKDILKQPEAIYGRPPKVDRYRRSSS